MLSAGISILLHGLAFAMVLYLISVGLAITMGLMGFVNLAHGVFAAAGGYLAINLIGGSGVPFPLAVLAAVAAVGVASVVLERLLYRHLYGSAELDQVLFTIGLIFITSAAARAQFGPLAFSLHPPPYLQGSVDLGFDFFPRYRAFLILAGAALVSLLWFGLERTEFGARIRAAVDNRRMAQSVGIDTDLLFTLTFALGGALAALGGALGADILSLEPDYALEHMIYFLIVVAVGGLGSLRGSFVAALFLGIFDQAFKTLLPQYGAFYIYALTLAILLWRPQGLFGRA